MIEYIEWMLSMVPENHGLRSDLEQLLSQNDFLVLPEDEWDLLVKVRNILAKYFPETPKDFLNATWVMDIHRAFRTKAELLIGRNNGGTS